jgi:hypothetical protein
VWAWLSWDKNWQPSGTWTPDYVPLFLGRLIGVPNMLNKEIITLDLVARPQDLQEQRIQVANELRVLPYFDPVWISADRWNDPDAVLEGYSRLWHFDRITHEVTTSDLIVGEEGTEEFREDEIPYNSVEMSLGQAPFRAVRVEGSVSWAQQFKSPGNGGFTIISGTTGYVYNGLRTALTLVMDTLLEIRTLEMS